MPGKVNQIMFFSDLVPIAQAVVGYKNLLTKESIKLCFYNMQLSMRAPALPLSGLISGRLFTE